MASTLHGTVVVGTAVQERPREQPVQELECWIVDLVQPRTPSSRTEISTEPSEHKIRSATVRRDSNFQAFRRAAERHRYSAWRKTKQVHRLCTATQPSHAPPFKRKSAHRCRIVRSLSGGLLARLTATVRPLRCPWSSKICDLEALFFVLLLDAIATFPGRVAGD